MKEKCVKAKEVVLNGVAKKHNRSIHPIKILRKHANNIVECNVLNNVILKDKGIVIPGKKTIPKAR